MHVGIQRSLLKTKSAMDDLKQLMMNDTAVKAALARRQANVALEVHIRDLFLTVEADLARLCTQHGDQSPSLDPVKLTRKNQKERYKTAREEAEKADRNLVEQIRAILARDTASRRRLPQSATPTTPFVPLPPATPLLARGPWPKVPTSMQALARQVVATAVPVAALAASGVIGGNTPSTTAQQTPILPLTSPKPSKRKATSSPPNQRQQSQRPRLHLRAEAKVEEEEEDAEELGSDKSETKE
ncbi:hypothetical protein BBJ28_00026292 [Nothophytophthora sp. Chile5]|nr:hypothetical protein BBJ28_00026292 [Nothophytophthora sp. Chile5]